MNAIDWGLAIIFAIAGIAALEIGNAVIRWHRRRKSRRDPRRQELIQSLRAIREHRVRIVEISIIPGIPFVEWCDQCMVSHEHVNLWAYRDDDPTEPHLIRVLAQHEESS